jgi:hypothetical protein
MAEYSRSTSATKADWAAFSRALLPSTTSDLACFGQPCRGCGFGHPGFLAGAFPGFASGALNASAEPLPTPPMLRLYGMGVAGGGAGPESVPRAVVAPPRLLDRLEGFGV